MISPDFVTTPRRSPSPSKGEAELDAVLENRLLEVLEIGGLGGIGMMVREGAVNVREEFGHLAAKGLEEPGGERPATPVARIDRNAH